MSRKLEKIGLAGKLLFEAVDEIYDDVLGEGFFLSKAAMRKMVRSWEWSDNQYRSAIYTLKKGRYIASKENQILITPKGINKAKEIKIENSDWVQKDWDGLWRVVIFDIPEKMRKERNFFRSFLKRKNFYKLQKSVFVAPFANFDELDFIRHEYGIEDYVNFFTAKSAGLDDDSLLRKKFNL